MVKGEGSMSTSILLSTLLTAGTLALMIAFVFYQIHKIEWLKEHGRQIVATVTAIRHETGKTRTGLPRDNYYITAKWTNPRTGKTYTFWTWIMNYCPNYVQGSLVSLLIDPNDPRRYTWIS